MSLELWSNTIFYIALLHEAWQEFAAISLKDQYIWGKKLFDLSVIPAKDLQMNRMFFYFG